MLLKKNNMDKFIKKKISCNEYRDALMGYIYKPYKVVSITKILGTNDYNLILKLE